MSLTGLRNHGVGFGFGQAGGLLLVFGLGLSACGPQISGERNELKADEPVAQTYQEWCTDWQLICPVAEPSKTDPGQFKALTTVINSALSSPTILSLTKQDFEAIGLKTAFTALHLDDVYQDIQTRLTALQWQSGGLESGALVVHKAAASAQRTDTGVVLNLAADHKVSVAPGRINVGGIGLSADAAKESPALQSIALGTDGNFSFALSDRSVNEIPQEFAIDNLLLAFGLDAGKLEGREIALPDIIAAAGPLIGWANTSTRQIALDRPFFTTTAPQLAVLLPKDAIGQNLGNLLNTFDKVRTSADPKLNLAAVNLVKGATAKCDLNNGEVKVKFSAEFGLKRYYQVNPTTLGVELYGVEASAKKALGISIKLKRIEIGAEKITILDVPILGKVELKLDEITKPGDKTTLICGA